MFDKVEIKNLRSSGAQKILSFFCSLQQSVCQQKMD